MEEIGLNEGAPSFSIMADNIRVCLCPGINCLCVKACISCKSLIFDKWEPRPHVLGQHISVSLLGQHVAYAMTCKNREFGMLCIVSSKDMREVVVRRVRGPICDLMFTRSAIDNLLAVIDAFGDVYVYEMGETKFGSLQVTNLLHISQSGDFASYYHHLCWYADDNRKILLVTDDHNSQVWDIKSILEKQGQGSYFREDISHSCVRLSHHSAPITCAVIAPQGKAVATVSLDGRLKVFFMNLSFGQYSREMPCVQSWEPHKGKTLSSVHFLNKEAPRQFSYQWIIATACDQNSEIKIWSMETFTCLQVSERYSYSFYPTFLTYSSFKFVFVRKGIHSHALKSKFMEADGFFLYEIWFFYKMVQTFIQLENFESGRRVTLFCNFINTFVNGKEKTRGKLVMSYIHYQYFAWLLFVFMYRYMMTRIIADFRSFAFVPLLGHCTS